MPQKIHNTKKMYNAQKYSNPTSFVAAKVGERYGKSAMNMGKSMMTQYNPSGMGHVQVDQALNSSKMGVPQASPYIRQ